MRSLSYIERHRAKMRLVRKRERIERKTSKVKIVLRRGNETKNVVFDPPSKE